MLHRVTVALPVLEAQLPPERLEHFRLLTDDPQLFTVEAVSAHVAGEIDLPDDVLRTLVSTLDLPLGDDPPTPAEGTDGLAVAST